MSVFGCVRGQRRCLGQDLDQGTSGLYIVSMAVVMNIGEAKTHLSALIQRAQSGEDVIVARDGTPAVRLVAYQPIRTPRFGWGGFDMDAESDATLFGGADVDELGDWEGQPLVQVVSQ